jgi:hypothetical protein
VLKTSIFFICRWSKELQGQLALKMEKIMFAPNERLNQPAGNERIFILTRGKVDIYLDKFGTNNTIDRRLLKSISVTGAKQISDNSYGYTAVISNKPCALDAVAPQFTTALYISKKDFEQCVLNNHEDREYYHEIKDKLDSS